MSREHPRCRVLVVDDSAVMRGVLREVLGSEPGIELVGTASDGRDALSKIEALRPDMLTLDVEMPGMGGLELLRELRRRHPKLPVIMLSTLTTKGAAATIDALLLGAADYVAKPSNVGGVSEGMSRIREELLPKIRALCPRHRELAEAPAPAAPTSAAPLAPAAAPRVLLIGASTGGPNALQVLFAGLGRSFPLPILLVQHMPPLFTRLLADKLGDISGIDMREAADGDAILPGRGFVAPGGRHMKVLPTPGGALVRLSDDPPENFCRPAVDVMFRSAAARWGDGVLAVVLTGMGADGRKGASEIRAKGGSVIVQDQATSVVWGMPGAVAGAGLADEILPLEAIAPEILRVVGARTRA